MNGSTSKILHQIFHTDSLKEVSMLRLEGLRDQFPYFAAGHYFLSKKQLQEHDNGYEMEAKKTALYFNNPYWLQWLLENDSVEAIPEATKTTEEKITEPEKNNNESFAQPISSTIETPKEYEEDPKPEAFISPEEKNIDPPIQEALIVSPHETIENNQEAAGEIHTEEIVEENNIETSATELINREHTESTQIPAPEKTQETVSQNEASENTKIELPATDKPNEPELNNNLGSNFAKNLPLFSSNEGKEGFLFEPYHTVDYFAFLGVKLQMDEQQPDKFGKQLKSFTDWLKSMKKLPQKTDENTPINSDEAAVEGYAAHSNQQKEIITEAMAEVLSKQGKNENAIELYRKLSLLNPSKSIYFATKIQQLKEH
jgi:hypothetical protein